MKRPLLPSLIFHAIAFAIGLGGAAFVSRSQPSSPAPPSESQPKTSHRRDRNSDSISLSSSSSFHAAYDSLIQRPMAEDDRNQCMEKLWKEWAASDPAGMLAFLESIRTWPKDFWIGPLLSEHPELLLPFALRQGSTDAINSLSCCDSSTVARLLAELPEEQKGIEIHKLEKQVARKLGNQGIPHETASPDYLSGVAESLLEAGRIEEFFDVFDQVGDPEQMGSLARKLGDVLNEEIPDDKVFDLFLLLPEEYRKYAVYGLTNYNGSSMEFPEVRQHHMRWLEKFAAAGFIQEAASGARELFEDDPTSITTNEIVNWVARFPEDGSWQPITEAIISSWNGRDRVSLAAMVTEICNLPESSARETLATEIYARYHTGFDPFVEEHQKIRKQLESLFTSPQAKERFEKRFSNNEDQVDPFAPAADPFAPAVDPFQE